MPFVSDPCDAQNQICSFFRRISGPTDVDASALLGRNLHWTPISSAMTIGGKQGLRRTGAPRLWHASPARSVLGCSVRAPLPCAPRCRAVLAALFASGAALAAENLFLCKQLALYQEHHVKPRRATNATCLTMVWLSQWFDWQSALVAVQPETFQRWRRRGRQLFWRGTAYPGRPPIPVELQGLIWQMARDAITWGQRRIANELLLKLGLRSSENSGQVHAHRSRSSARPSRAVAALADLVHNHARALGSSAVWPRPGLPGRRRPCSSASCELCSRWDRSVARRVPGTDQGDARAAVLLRDTIPAHTTWSLDTEMWLLTVGAEPGQTWRRHLPMSPAPPPEPPRWTRSSWVLAVAALARWDRPVLTHGAPSPCVMGRRRLPRCSA